VLVENPGKSPFVVPPQVGPPHILPDEIVITVPSKIAEMILLSKQGWVAARRGDGHLYRLAF
jgi:hypothetical protein